MIWNTPALQHAKSHELLCFYSMPVYLGFDIFTGNCVITIYSYPSSIRLGLWLICSYEMGCCDHATHTQEGHVAFYARITLTFTIAFIPAKIHNCRCSWRGVVSCDLFKGLVIGLVFFGGHKERTGWSTFACQGGLSDLLRQPRTRSNAASKTCSLKDCQLLSKRSAKAARSTAIGLTGLLPGADLKK